MIKRIAAISALLGLTCLTVPLVGSQSAAKPLLGGRVHESFQPTKGKIFILVIGNDARSGNPDNARADAIHILGINTKTMKGGILNFPRDSWVSIPGYGSGKINEALFAGGPLGLARTLENLTGIRLDYWVMTGFEGFRGIIRSIKGVRMRIPSDVYDPTGSGARLENGVQNLNAKRSLAYVRTRHSFPRGDIDRTTHQADFLLALLRKLRRQVSVNPAALLKWIAATREHARFDMSAAELFRLGVLATQVRPRDVGSVTVSASVGAVGSASVVFISSSAGSIYKRFRETGRL